MAYGSKNNRKKILSSIVEGADGGSIMGALEASMKEEDNRSRGRGAVSAAKSLEDTYEKVSSMKRSLGEQTTKTNEAINKSRSSDSSIAKDWMTVLSGQAEADKPANDIKRSEMLARRMADPQTDDDKFLRTGKEPMDVLDVPYVPSDNPDDAPITYSGDQAAGASGRTAAIDAALKKAQGEEEEDGPLSPDDMPITRANTDFPSRIGMDLNDNTEGEGLMTRPKARPSSLEVTPDETSYEFMESNSLFRTALKEKEAGSYSTLFGNSEQKNTPFKGVDITTMPMSEVLDLVELDGDFHTYNKDTYKKNTTAIGKYQFVGATLRDLKKRGVFKKLGITDDTIFDESTQDALSAYQAVHRIRDRGDGTMSGARKEMRNEWEGFKKLSDSRLDSIINEISSEIGVNIGGTKLAPRKSQRPKSRPTK